MYIFLLAQPFDLYLSLVLIMSNTWFKLFHYILVCVSLVFAVEISPARRPYAVGIFPFSEPYQISHSTAGIFPT